jgi:xylulose-5-phosphate/fructose-6-phosphate phosphoketolase
MTVLNDLDRFHLVDDVLARVPGLLPDAAETRTFVQERLAAHRAYIVEHGDDMPEVRDWIWNAQPVRPQQRRAEV